MISHSRLHKLICEDWQYCAKQELFNTNIDLAAAVAGWLTTSLTGFPIVAIAVLLVKRGLKVFCQCK
jgi:hypothetical protein